MKLDDLIARLARDRAQPVSVAHAFALALGLGIVLSLGVFTLMLGARPDLPEALQRPAVAVKPVLGLLAAAGCLRPLLICARPGAPMRPGLTVAPVMVLPPLAALLVWLELRRLPPAEWWPAFVGDSLPVFLVAMPLLAAPILGTSLLALRHGACTMPALTGGLAGLLSGGLGVAIYAIYCTEDSALFYGIWYTFGMALVGGLGAVLGPAVLRW